jgi:hypothetical protein
VKKSVSLFALVGIVAGFAFSRASAQSNVPLVTERDRAEIQDLVSHYARALSSCAAEEYADLFAPVTGSFASSVRGEIIGHDKLIALVQSEPHCITTPAGRPAGNGPTVVVTASADGVTGIADLGNAGRYEDVYVTTPSGWRFKTRNVITRQEQAANFTAKDFISLRQLAGSEQGKFDDVYRETPVGRRLRSAGLVIAVTPEGATGRAYLRNDGGHYDDVYARSSGEWRFKSRTYVAGDTAGTQASAGR